MILQGKTLKIPIGKLVPKNDPFQALGRAVFFFLTSSESQVFPGLERPWRLATGPLSGENGWVFTLGKREVVPTKWGVSPKKKQLEVGWNNSTIGDVKLWFEIHNVFLLSWYLPWFFQSFLFQPMVNWWFGAPVVCQPLADFCWWQPGSCIHEAIRPTKPPLTAYENMSIPSGH